MEQHSGPFYRLAAALVQMAPAVVCAVVFWATLRDVGALLDYGGWFAVFGQFLAVSAAMVLLLIAGALALGMLLLPVILLIRLGDPVSRALRPPRDAGLAGRTALRLADAAWKSLWWGWWRVVRSLRGGA